MLPPIQNQELLQRSETLSELRSLEQGKAFGDVAKAAAEMHKQEHIKESTVQEEEETAPSNEDGKGKGQEQEQKNKEKESEPETNTPAGHPAKLEGGDILDLLA